MYAKLKPDADLESAYLFHRAFFQIEFLIYTNHYIGIVLGLLYNIRFNSFIVGNPRPEVAKPSI